MARFLKPDGQLGIAGAGLMHELEGPVPPHLSEWWATEMPYCLHSAGWWRQHWERTGILDVAVADTLSDGWRFWVDWLRVIAPDNVREIRTLEVDAGRNLGYVRAVGRRRAEAKLLDPIMSMTAKYTKQPLLRRRKR